MPMPGVAEAIALFRRLRLPVAIASGSPRRMIDVVCERLGLQGVEVRCSAMEEPRSKPAPDVYLTAARRLGVRPRALPGDRGLAERGAAAKGAGMRCIAVPDPLLGGDPGYGEADLVLGALTELREPVLRSLGVRHTATPVAGRRAQGALTSGRRRTPGERRPSTSMPSVTEGRLLTGESVLSAAQKTGGISPRNTRPWTPLIHSTSSWRNRASISGLVRSASTTARLRA